MDDFSKFYTAFEDRFRGSFEMIKSRLATYIPALKNPDGTALSKPVLDLGSGRGEWLELLKEGGFTAFGVDQNPCSAARGTDRGLEIIVGDLFDVMRERIDGSFGAITAFHVIEHLPWELQLKLLQEAHRLLAPDGLLIVEWPNAENVEVATSTFWLDPTHTRLLPASLVSFMVEYVGFRDIQTLRFRPSMEAAPPAPENADGGLLNRLFRDERAEAARQHERQVTAKAGRLFSQGRDIAIMARRSRNAIA